MSETLHKHHIVPLHMGGMDEPFNIMELSREDHAWAHLILHKLYGKWEDLAAAQLLMNRPGMMLGHKRPEWAKKMTGESNPMKRPEARKKLSETMTGRKQPEGWNKKSWETRRKKYGATGGNDETYALARAKGWEGRRKKYGPSGGNTGDASRGVPRPDMVGDKNPMNDPAVVAKMMATRKRNKL